MGMDTTHLTRAAYYLIPDDATDDQELLEATRDCLVCLMVAMEWEYESWGPSNNASVQLVADIACDPSRLRAMLKKFPSYNIDESMFPDIMRLLVACLAKQAGQETSNSANEKQETAMTLTPADLATIRDVVREEIRFTLEYPPDLVRWSHQLKMKEHLGSAVREGLSKILGKQIFDDATSSANNALDNKLLAYLDTARCEVRELREMILQLHNMMQREGHDDDGEQPGPQGEDASKDGGPEEN